MKRAGSHARLSEPAFDAFGEKIDERWMIVGAGDLLEGFSTRLEKSVTSLLLKFFKRLQAVGRERGRKDEKRLHAHFRQTFELVIGIWRQPRLADQAGLKRDRMLSRWNPRPRNHGARSREALRPIAGCMRRRASELRAGRDAARLPAS